MPIFGTFPIGGGVKSDEDNLGLVCVVIGVLTPPEEKERKNGLFNQVECNPILAFATKRVVGEKKTGNGCLTYSS